MNRTIFSKILAFCFALFLQTGAVSAADDSDLNADDNSKTTASSASSETKTLRFDSSWLGLNGPIQVTTSYNSDYGAILGINFATYVNAMNALAFEAELGTELYRLNATWGFAVNERNRFKLSVERLAEKDDYDFASGTETEWVGQNAVGASYQYIVADGWLQTVDFNAYGAQAESIDFDDVLFQDSAGNPLVNKRRITGGMASGVSAGLTTQPWDKARLQFALHYDSVQYSMQNDSSDPSTSGLGFSSDLEQVFTERLKGDVGVEMLSTDHSYSAGLTWLAPTEMGSRLEIGVLTNYLNSQTTGDSNFELGVQAAYGWDEGPSGDVPRFTGFGSLGIEDLKTWTRDPAVRMPEVMAVVDEAVVDARPRLASAGLQDQSFPEKSPVTLDVSSAFSSPDSSTLTHTATGLPDGLTISSRGVISGTTPDVMENAEYLVAVTASNRWGYTHTDDFLLTVLAHYAPPVVLDNIPSQMAYEENVPDSLDVAQYFVDPNTAPSSAMQRQNKAVAAHMTYELEGTPAGWDTPLAIQDNTSGVLYFVTPLFKVGSSNEYDIAIKATNYIDNTAVGSQIATLKVKIVDDASNPLPAGAIPSEELKEYESSDIDFSNYFQDQQTGHGKDLIYSEQGNGLEGSGFTVESNGTLSGQAVNVPGLKTYTTVIRATNGVQLDGKELFAVQPFSLTIVPTSGAIIATTPAAQFELEQTQLTPSNSINLNDYFSHSEPNKTLDYSNNNLSELGSVSVDENGFIVGTLNDVANNTTVSINVTAADTEDPEVESQQVSFDYTLLANVSSAPILAKSGEEYKTFTIDLNDAGNGEFKPSADGDLTYILSNAPQGWTIDQQTGVLSGTVPNYNTAYPSENRYVVTVRAKNTLAVQQGLNLETTQDFVFDVQNLAGSISLDPKNTPAGAVYTGAEGKEAFLDLNEIFVHSNDEPMVFSDNDSDNKLADIGLRISQNGTIEGQLNVDENKLGYEVVITARDQDESEEDVKPAEITLVYNVYAQVSSTPIANQDKYEGRGSYADNIYTLDVNDAGSGEFQPNVTDEDTAANLKYSLTVPPSLTNLQWKIDEDGVISGWMPNYVVGNADANSYTIVVKAENVMDSKLNTQQSYQLKVLPYYITAGSSAADFEYDYMERVNQDLRQNITYHGNMADLTFSVSGEDANKLTAMNLSLASDGKLTTRDSGGAQAPATEMEAEVTVTNSKSGASFKFPLKVAVGETTGATLTVSSVPNQTGTEGVVYSKGSENEIDLHKVFTYKGPGTLSFSEVQSDDANLSDISLSINSEGYIVGTTAVDANFDGTITLKASDGIDPSLGGVSETVNIKFEVLSYVTSSQSTVNLGRVAESTPLTLDLNSAAQGNFLPNVDGQLIYEITPDSEFVTRNGSYTFDQGTGKLTITVPVYYEAYASNLKPFDNDYSFTVKAVNAKNPALYTTTSYEFTSINDGAAIIEPTAQVWLTHYEKQNGSYLVNNWTYEDGKVPAPTELRFADITFTITQNDSGVCQQATYSLASDRRFTYDIPGGLDGNNSDCIGYYKYNVQAIQGDYIKATLPEQHLYLFIDD